jgi:predicted HAD superfamily Cof-like phosphohydrolase
MATPHYERVKDFMQRVGQPTPDHLTIPDERTRILRAKLILEEALETVRALGVQVTTRGDNPVTLDDEQMDFNTTGNVDMIEIVDGCADISVVTIGTLIAIGVDDEPILEEVDASNLRKFEPGSYRREDGKWMKHPGWTPPDINAAIGRGNG